MEKTVMKSRNSRKPSANTVNSWPKQPQGNPKEVQPVIIPPGSTRRPDGWSAPSRDQDRFAHRYDPIQAKAARPGARPYSDPGLEPIPLQIPAYAVPPKPAKEAAVRRVRWNTFPW